MEGRAPIVKDKNGDFFIDRNGNLFPHVIEYLYNDKFYLKSKGRNSLNRIKNELSFFGLIKPG